MQINNRYHAEDPCRMVSMTRYENRGSHGGNGGSVWHVPESLSRFSGTVFGQKSRQLTPEGLSMFYQRDARRFS